MTTLSFTDGWTVGPKTTIYAALQGAGRTGTPVTLPHDALLASERSADRGEGAHSAFFPGGAFSYSKTFDVPDEYRGKRLTLEFQGAYRDAVVFINDVFAAQRPNGYSTFYVRLDPFLTYGAPNTVTVDVRASDDSRWYTGAGLYRDVRLHIDELAHVVPNGVRITTSDVDPERAVVEIATSVRNENLETETLTVETELRGPDHQAVASDSAPVTLRSGETVTVRQRLYVDDPELWSTDSPQLYEARTRLTDVVDVLADQVTTFGIRTLQLDPRHGLRINGQMVKLRGACIHHDNGLLGAAAIARAEERRVRILKEAGFNAIRSAHNPVSQAMLEACDRHGLLVMDEVSDVWTVSKSTNDYSLAFPEWWERDVQAMVDKDFNHPSVIMYSIGNENPETGNGLAAQWGRRLVDRIRTLDPSRYVTNGVNGLVAAISEVDEIMQQNAEAAAAGGDQGVNGAMNTGDFMNHVSASAQVTERTAEAFSMLDIAGMNYGDARYELDKTLFPNRIIVGTETFPSHIDVNWRLVEDNPHVIGDFTWTGWDYLGEAGAGRIAYLEDGDGGVPSFEGGFPWLTAWNGDIDITGHRRPISYYRETVFGRRHVPYIAVQRPETYGKPAFAGQWSWSDTVSGWSWKVDPGAVTTVEVYSDADEVELVINGRSAGTQPAGRAHAFKAVFTVEFEPGEVEAVSYVGGREQARTILRSASGPLHLDATAERAVIAATTADLAYIPIAVRDRAGNLAHAQDWLITVSVEGPAVLQALGSGRPEQLERFDTGEHTSFDGHALAIVRPTGAGEITVRIQAEGLEPVTVVVLAEAAESDHGPQQVEDATHPAVRVGA
jgi:beta-galactosidase